MRRAVLGMMLAAAASVAACGGGGGGRAPQSPPQAPPPPAGPVVGIDQRPANAACVAPSRTAGSAAIALERVFGGLAFDQPLAMLQAPGDESRWFVLEKTGSVRVFPNQPNASAHTAFITLSVNSSSEGGLLGMAFDPDFAGNRHVYLSFTEGGQMVSTVARFTSHDDGATLAPGSRQDVIQVNQPFTNHNGGHIAFGPDGHLYIGLGDGGSGGDPRGYAQRTSTLLGKLLRLDVHGAAPYDIPADNPFAGRALCSADPDLADQDCPEIYAWGFRNPWRWSFDSATGALWAGDVGQGAFEEVDIVEPGGNYGWSCREGTSTFSTAPSCSAGAFVDPVHQYGRSAGVSITGGYVYRGSLVPALVGSYVFGDFGTGRIWRLIEDGNGGYDSEELLGTSLQIASFAEDADGELYVVDLGGTLHRLVAGAAAPGGPPLPVRLSETGCVNPQSPSQAASGLIPYRVGAPFWSDGADKERWLALPNGTAISVAADGDFILPSGAVLMKHFRLSGTLVETRLFMRHPDGGWAGYTYEWNGEQTDAALVTGGKTTTVGQQTWIFPSGNDCMTCHTAAAGFALGLEAAQLNHDFSYPSTGRTANQLRTLDHIVLFTTPLGDPALQPRAADPADDAADLGDRARAYLHSNCAGCHRPGGPTGSSLDFRLGTALADTQACDVPPQAGDLGLGAQARLIAPGRPDDSVVLARLTRRDANAMPPLASAVVDTAGADRLRDWIASLSSCM